MNHKILELARQAAQLEGWGPEVWQTTFTEKFANLIIKECIKTVNDKGETYSAYWIEKHFGVE